MFSKRMEGVTLIELIIAIVIIAAALGGLVAAFTRANAASADPVIRRQMVAIAENMMEEIMLKPYTVGPGTGTRAQFDDIFDYAGYPANSPVTDVGGTPVPGLGSYTVTVSVSKLAANAITDIAPPDDATRIQVTVRNGAESLTLSGWRMRP